MSVSLAVLGGQCYPLPELRWESQEDIFSDELIAESGVGSERELDREIL